MGEAEQRLSHSLQEGSLLKQSKCPCINNGGVGQPGGVVLCCVVIPASHLMQALKQQNQDFHAAIRSH